jgi:hypothetical protein
MQQLLRLRIIVKTRLTLASDCRRLMRLAATVRSHGASIDATFLLMLVDRAWRRPRLSAMLAKRFAEFQATHCSCMEAAWKAFVQVRRRKEARQQNAVMWKSTMSLNCRNFITSLTAATVVDVIARLKLSTGSVNAMQAAATLAELPHISSYSAFSMIRLLPACLNLQITDAESSARTMSDAVHSLEEFVPLAAALRMSAVASRCSSGDVTHGDAALVLCEAGKALVVLGVLPVATSEWSSEVLRTAFASKATTALIKALDAQQPVTDAQISTIKCARAAESRLVDAAMPRTRFRWDRAPHFCAGAEMIACLVSKKLEGYGWLDPAFGADVFNDVG